MKAFKFYQVNYMLAKKTITRLPVELDVTIMFQGMQCFQHHESQWGVHFWEKFLRFLPLWYFAIIQLQSHHMLPFSISDNFWTLASVCLCWKCHFVVGMNA